MSFLNTSTTVRTQTIIPAHITKEQILSLLHDNTAMHNLNPLIKSATPLPPSSSTTFFTTVPSASKPPLSGPLPASGHIPVYRIVEAANGAEDAGGWRGGWAKRFVPDEISYETSNQEMVDGMITITHAPLGVNSVTTWRVGEEEGGLVVVKEGVITASRFFMGFIKTTIQGSHEKLADDFVATLEKRVAEEGKVEEDVKAEEGAEAKQETVV